VSVAYSAGSFWMTAENSGLFPWSERIAIPRRVPN
jgi:hypothetical protein